MGLSAAYRGAIVETLEAKGFCDEDFHIDDESEDCIFQILFEHDDFSFRVRENRLSLGMLSAMGGGKDDFSPQLKVVMGPGEALEAEELTTTGYPHIHKLVEQWVDNIRLELKARKASKRNAEVSNFMDQMKEAVEEQVDEDEEFSPEEQEKWIERLDALTKKYEQLLKDQEITRLQFDGIQKEFEGMKADFEVFSKKTWLKVGIGRIGKIATAYLAGKEGQKLITALGKKFLDGAKGCGSGACSGGEENVP